MYYSLTAERARARVASSCDAKARGNPSDGLDRKTPDGRLSRQTTILAAIEGAWAPNVRGVRWQYPMTSEGIEIDSTPVRLVEELP